MYSFEALAKIQKLLEQSQSDTISIPKDFLTEIERFMNSYVQEEINEDKAWEEMRRNEDVHLGLFLYCVDWSKPDEEDFENLKIMCQEILDDEYDLNDCDIVSLQKVASAEKFADIENQRDLIDNAVLVCQNNRIEKDILEIDKEEVFKYWVTLGGPSHSINFHIRDGELAFAESSYAWGEKYCKEWLPESVAIQLWNKIREYAPVSKAENTTNEYLYPH